MSYPSHRMAPQVLYNKLVLEIIASWFVDRLAGTKYVLGVSTPVANGDLSGRNFSRRAGLRNEQKEKARSIVCLDAQQGSVLAGLTWTLSVALPTPIIAIPVWDLELYSWAWSWSTGTSASSGESIAFKRNATTLDTATVNNIAGPNGALRAITPVQLAYGDTLQWVFTRPAGNALSGLVLQAFVKAKHIR